MQPPLKSIKARIEYIENLDLTLVEIDEIKSSLKLLFTDYILSTPYFVPGAILYRGIPYSEKPIHLSFLSYPPKKLTQINRANRENDPLFYCSTSEFVPFFDLGLSKGEKLVISKWKTTKELLINNIGYTDSTFDTLKSKRKKPSWNNNSAEFYKKENKIIREFLSRTFCQTIHKERKELYKLTIAIAEKHYKDDIFNGLMYPTIPMCANADNFALKTEFIDNCGVAFQEVYYIEIIDVLDKEYNIKRLDWANSISQDGIIEWKGRLPEWSIENEGDELHLKVINGRWVGIDKEGNVVEQN